MEIVKLGNKEPLQLQCPIIVNISGDYYVVSKKFYPTTFTNKGEVRYIAINLNDGKWFDWGSDIPCLNLEMETFEKGTKFEIII